MTAQKVLIVEGDKNLLLGLNVRLSAWGYKVLLATDAISAISVAQKEEPDLIILDIALPAGDGFMVMERMSYIIRLATVPIIVLTSRDPSTNRQRALDAGAKAFLQKPVDNDVLLAAIREALGQKDITSEKEVPTEEEAHVTKQKVLIVEDDKDMLRGLDVRLSAWGYEVLLATDTISATSVAQKEVPDLIILDIGLPAGDGFVVMERMSLQSNLATIPIIILTGRDPLANRQRALDAGVKAFLQKPVDNDVLLAAIQEALGQSDNANRQDTPLEETVSPNLERPI